MEILLLLIQVPLLIVVLRYLQKQQTDPLLYQSYYYLLSLKATAGMLVGILYFNYYREGDTLVYWKDLELLSEYFYKDAIGYIDYLFSGSRLAGEWPELETALQPRAWIFIKLISPFYILSGNNYWILAVYLSLFAFAGFWVLADTLVKQYRINSWVLLLAFFVYPSFVFWSSGVMKESLIMGVMGFLISFLLNLFSGTTFRIMLRVVLIALLSWILLDIKFYYFAVLYAVLFPYVVTKKAMAYFPFLQQNKAGRIGTMLGLMLLIALLVSTAHPLLNIQRVLEAVYLNYEATHVLSGGKNSFVFEGLSAAPESFLPHAPQALAYGLFGPYLWHCKNTISLLSGIENTWLLTLFVTAVVYAMKTNAFRKIDLEATAIIVYVAVLAMLMAFASPNWGTLVRYKVGFLPFLLLLLLHQHPWTAYIEQKLKRWTQSFDKK
jgi:hypothetical protein